MQAERLLCPGAAPDFICCNFPNVIDVMERKRAGEKLVRKKKIAFKDERMDELIPEGVTEDR